MSTLTMTAATELFRRPPDRFVDVGAGEVAHRKIGTGPDVLFVHGWPVSGATFRTLLPHLVDHVTCHVIDLPGAGSSRFGVGTELSVSRHIESVRRVVDALGLDDLAVVGHDSGGLIARHAMAGDSRLRSMGIIDSEHPNLSWRFRSFIAGRHLPGFGIGLAWVAARPRLRRLRFLLGDAFADRSHLDGEFAELFLLPLARSTALREAATKVLESFDLRLVHELPEIHDRIDVPVQLVWGELDAFFPVERARAMVPTFPDARIEVIPDAGLFSHEERPVEVAAALMQVLSGPAGARVQRAATAPLG